MKKVLFAFSVISLLIACEPEPKTECCDGDESGVVNIQVKASFDGEDFVTNEVYTINDTMNLRVESLKFYLTNQSVLANPQNQVFLFEGQTANFEFEASPYGYDGLNFYFGLDSITNHSDPSLYASDHPLSSFNNTHWSWAQGYKFMILEGKFDSDGDNIPDQSFSYHLGNDEYLKLVELDKTFVITGNQTTNLKVSMDVSNLFQGLDIATTPFTHSTGQFDVVELIATNAQNSFNIE